VLIEAQDWMKAKIKEGGVQSLLPLMEEPLFKLIAEFKAAEEGKRNISSQKAEEKTLDCEQ
jgi:hypothetical protein